MVRKQRLQKWNVIDFKSMARGRQMVKYGTWMFFTIITGPMRAHDFSRIVINTGNSMPE